MTRLLGTCSEKRGVSIYAAPVRSGSGMTRRPQPQTPKPMLILSATSRKLGTVLIVRRFNGKKIALSSEKTPIPGVV
jgi:hypothetical protein